MVLRRHGVRRLASGGLRVTLSARERDALRSLPAQLRPIVSGEADEEPARALRARLYPPASTDAELEAEYRELAGEELVAARVDALETFARTLGQGETRGATWSVELQPEDAQAWLGVVNDARLILAGVVGITSEEQWERGFDADDPASALLWYLGWLEEELVGALLGSLPER